jgi:DNA repair photolyase
MKVIYIPTGRALEYSPLACNLYTGCTHACKYCFAPGVSRTDKVTFHSKVIPRLDIINKIEIDCKKMENDPREILLCFMCDPYPEDSEITRQALEIFEKYNMKVQILTKGGLRAMRDFDLLKVNDWGFGTSMVFYTDTTRKLWEPNAASLKDRIEAIEIANDMGIRTWISIEPIIDIEESLKLLRHIKRTYLVSHVKIGKLNHMYHKDKSKNWKYLVEEAERILDDSDISYYIKKDTWEAAGRIWTN